MTASDTTAADTFTALWSAEWTTRIAELGAPHDGDTGVDNFLPDESPAAWQRRAARWTETLTAVLAIDASDLDSRTRVDRAVYLQQLEVLIAQVENRQFERPANADSAFWTDHAGRAAAPLRHQDDALAYIAQLSQLPRWFGQHIDNMRTGLTRGFAPPRVSMIGRSDPVRSVADAEHPNDTSYADPFLTAHAGGVIATEVLDSALAVIRTAVIPAHVDLLRFLDEDYLPHLPEEIAATSSPGGADYYSAQLAEFTTTTLDATAVFELGKREVATLREEMRGVAVEAGFDGDVDAMLAFMRVDTRFYATTAEDLLKEAAWHCKRFDAIVHNYFGRVPLRRFGIVEPPPALAPFYTFGRGGLDRYTLNTYNLPARPLYSLAALTLHEAAPGHCFQIALSSEMDELPPFRRHVYISAYGEGWALYTERLGVEMGMYRDPFEVMGMLSFQMWRAARLVVDPGMHAFGWSRAQAQDFLRANTAIAEHEIVTEIDRYIAWPGQATSYFIGQLAIVGLREKAELELGADFDIRWFHDLVLGFGSVPVEVLENEITSAINERRTGSQIRGTQ
jgi:uncharacterized protein (DUF885 family)